ncbi:type VI secretion system baseplate subunit TssG [Sphingomonas sp. BK235]|uniref:type VI secretion system baseplate subunit TssG n=1 Tax=Sphingomonas sp. BK235 TaxID=2512131 RepID=UPI001043A3E4|nr:type VI secretion system baseplate subunit TssG [Sphingomonas sp. BK235]TCP33698.1 type VI secretion system protein ImpH [Sphingomonas sp. BK235]
MASAARPAPDHLSHLAHAATAVARVEPLALLRGVEARAPALPRIGEARRPEDDLVALVHAPALAFPAATLTAIQVAGAHATVEGQWLGLTGPMGPLPLHLSEYAADERRHARRQPFGGFLDVLSGRMLQLFYRAWAAAVPAASADRPDDDRLAGQIAALTGATDGAAAAQAFPAAARLRYAALFASPRSPGGIAGALSDLLRVPVRIVEHVERWRDVARDEQSALAGGHAALGGGALAGARVCTADEAFKVVIAVRSRDEHRALLPGGARYALLVEALDAFAPPQLEWEIELAVAPAAVSPARLGGTARLGWDSYTGAAAPGRVRAEARLGAQARRLARQRSQETAA